MMSADRSAGSPMAMNAVSYYAAGLFSSVLMPKSTSSVKKRHVIPFCWWKYGLILLCNRIIWRMFNQSKQPSVLVMVLFNSEKL